MKRKNNRRHCYFVRVQPIECGIYGSLYLRCFHRLKDLAILASQQVTRKKQNN